MRILVVGRGEFIGRHIAIEAARAGHEVVACGRDTAPIGFSCSLRWITTHCDFARDGLEELAAAPSGRPRGRQCRRHLSGDKTNSLETVHVTGPRALFEAYASSEFKS